MLGGLGICGKTLCCKQFLQDFAPVSIKMAKEQGLSLNPTKISGACGRFMCCLKYEHEVYEDLSKITPKVGAIVKTPDGKGTVDSVFLLAGKIRVKFAKGDDIGFSEYKTSDVHIIKDVKPIDDAIPEEILEILD